MEEVIENTIIKEENIITKTRLLNEIKTLSINTITTNDRETFKIGNKIITTVYATKDKPLVLKDNYDSKKTLIINKEYFNEHQEEVMELISKIVSQVNESNINITNKELINDNVIKALSTNNTLQKINIAKYSSQKYMLKQKDYEVLKNSNIKEVETGGVEKELENNFDDLIGYNANRNLIGYCRYKDLLKNSVIKLGSNVTEEELENFKYLNQINKEYEFSISENNIEDIEKINKRLEELGRTDKIFIRPNLG